MDEQAAAVTTTNDGDNRRQRAAKTSGEDDRERARERRRPPNAAAQRLQSIDTATAAVVERARARVNTCERVVMSKYENARAPSAFNETK